MYFKMAHFSFHFILFLFSNFVYVLAETSCASYEVEWYGTCVPCPAGYYFLNQTCEKCSATSISVAGASQCTECPSDSQPNSKQDHCVCDSGYYSTDIMPDHDQGPLHPIGVHSEEQIVSDGTCQRCTVGFCPENTFLNGGVCEQCPSGAYSKSGSVSGGDCKCLNGELVFDGLMYTCRSCASETFYNGGGLSSCTGCTAPKMSLLNCAGTYEECCVDTSVFPCPIGTLPRDRNGGKCSHIGLRIDTENTEDEFGRILPMKRLSDGTLQNQPSLNSPYLVGEFTWKHSGYPLSKISKGDYSLCAKSLVTGNVFSVDRSKDENLALAWNWQDNVVHKSVDGVELRVVDFDCRWSTVDSPENTFLLVPNDMTTLLRDIGYADIYIMSNVLNGQVVSTWTDQDYNMQIVAGLDFLCFTHSDDSMNCHGNNALIPAYRVPLIVNSSTLVSGPQDVCSWDHRIVRCWGTHWGLDGTTIFEHPETLTGQIKQVTVHYYADSFHTAVCILYGSDIIQCVAKGISINYHLGQGTPFLYEKKISAISTGNDPRKICIEVDHRNYECYNVFSTQALTILEIRSTSDETNFNSQLDAWKNQNTQFVQRLIAANPILHLNPFLAHSNGLDAGHSLSSPVFMRPYYSRQFTTSQESFSELPINERGAFFEGNRCPYLNHYCNKTRSATPVEFDGVWTVGGAGHPNPGNNESNSDTALWVFVLRTLNSANEYTTVMELDILQSTLEAREGMTRLVSPGRTLRNPDTSLSTGVLEHMHSGYVKTVLMVKISKHEPTAVRLIVQDMKQATFMLAHDISHHQLASLPDANTGLHIKQILFYESPDSIDEVWQMTGTSFEDTFEDLSQKVVVTNDAFRFVTGS